MAVALETIVKQLSDSGIVAAGKLKDFIPPNAHPKDTEELLRELHKQNLLTQVQAQQVSQGKIKALILGEYTILDKIGAGGMGQVFKAEHRRMKRAVAIKTLPAATMKDAAAVARFQREVEAAAKLFHPNIVPALDAGQGNGVHFLVMEYVEGKDLSATVKKDGPFPVAKAVNYILQAARGLEFAHSEGVVHRDIKPANLLLDKKGTVKILDMGLARIEQGDGEAQAELTGTGAVMGTVDYMSPEQAMSTKDADARADIYSLGCSLHYLIAGKATYSGNTAIEKLLAHRDQPIPNLRAVSSDVSDELEAVFEKMVAKNVEDRYQTMTEVVADLENCSSGQATSLSIRQSASTNIYNTAMTFFKNAPAQPTQGNKPTTKAASTKTGKDKKKLALIGAAVLGVLIVAGIIVSLQTKDGTLIVEVNQPDAMVQVLDAEGKVEISQKGGTGKITIGVDPGKHRLRVEKEGFTVYAENFEVEVGGKKEITAKLVPVKIAAPVAVPTKSALAFTTPAFQAWMKDVAALSADKQVEAVSKKLMELNPGFDGKVTGWNGQGTPKIDNGVVTELGFATDSVTDISPVRALVGLTALNCGGSGPGRREVGKLVDLSPLQGLPITNLNCIYTQVSDLSPLKGMPLTRLNCGSTKVSDLLPLQGMLLTILTCTDTQVSDLSPLQGIPLTQLYCRNSKVSNLSPLEVSKNLTILNLVGTKVTPAQVAALQKSLPNCKIEWDDPAKVAGGQLNHPWNTPAFQAWVKEVQAMPAEEQIKAVSKKLMELNPGFDGKVTGIDGKGTPKIENGMVKSLWFVTDNVTDISPVRALLGLTFLNCSGSDPGKGKLSDLSPLKGMSLTTLACENTQVSDLSPLEGMPLTSLHFNQTQVSELSPLRGMPLTKLTCGGTRILNLTLLEGLPLTSLYCSYTQVSDLSPLAKVRTLVNLSVQGTKLTPASVATLQKALPNCKIEWDGAAKPITNINDPAFIQWTKTVAAMPADKQIEAVSKKLVELNPEFDGKVTPTVDKGVVTGLAFLTDNMTDISPVRALVGLKNLSCIGSVGTKGIFSDLSPVQGMKLSSLSCSFTKVSDLSSLQGMPLSYLGCSNTQVSDLSPLEGMNFLYDIRFTPKNITKGLDFIRQMKSLKIIGIGGEEKDKFPPTEFWKKYDAGEFGKPAAPAKLAYLDPAFQAWMKDVAALPAEQQIEAVSKKLVELNPGFDGKMPGADEKGSPKIENSSVTELGFVTDNVTDISPVRALPGLKVLSCGGSSSGKGKLSDLSPLQGMKLRALWCGNTQVSDLLPVQGMKLYQLKCHGTQVSDLSPLRGIPLSSLSCYNTQVVDLSPLKGMPFNDLWISSTNVSDLSPLEDCKSLKTLEITSTKVTPASVAALQKALPNCKIEWDGAAKLAYLDPAFQQWMKDVQAMPADKQIEAVSKKLMELNPGFDGKVTEAYGKGKPKIDNGVVTDFGFATDDVTDISPVRGLSGLKDLSCAGIGGIGKLSDLSPLNGLSLTNLTCGANRLTNLSPLKGMALKKLFCGGTLISDLSPLESCVGLTQIRCGGTKVTATTVAALQAKLPNCKIEWDDPAKAIATQPNQPWNTPAFQAWVKEVAAMPADKQVEAVSKKLMELNPGFDGKVRGGEGSSTPRVENNIVTELSFVTNNVTDISPVRAFTGLKALSVYGTIGKVKFSSLAPLEGMSLTYLHCSSTEVSNISLLKGMPLTILICGNTNVSDLSPLHDSPSLNYVYVKSTKVTPAGVAALQKALPNCKIEWDDPAKPKTPEPAASGTK